MALIAGEASASGISDWFARHDRETIVSDFGRGEFIAALRLKQRIGEISTSAFRDFRLTGEAWFASTSMLSVVSADIAVATNYLLEFDIPLRLPDAIHIAIAARSAATLATLDRRQLRAAVAFGVDAIDPLLDRAATNRPEQLD